MVKIFHNPNCGTSRNALALIRNSGVEPEVVLYVETPLGTRLCRPSEVVIDILVDPQRGAFTKEDGEVVINEKGSRV